MNWWTILSSLMMFLAIVALLFVMLAAGRSALHLSDNEREAAESEIFSAAMFAFLSIGFAFFSGRLSVTP